MIVTPLIALLAATESSLPATGCAPATEAEVRAEFARWSAAYEARDLAGTMAIFAPDVRIQVQGTPDFGRDQLEASYRADFARAEGGRWTPAWEDIIVSGDLAAAFSTWTLTAPAPVVNRSLDLLRREADCRWRITRSITYPLRRPGAPAPEPRQAAFFAVGHG